MATETRGGSEGHVGTQHLPAHRMWVEIDSNPKGRGLRECSSGSPATRALSRGGEGGPKAEDMWDKQWGKKTALAPRDKAAGARRAGAELRARHALAPSAWVPVRLGAQPSGVPRFDLKGQQG